MGIMFSFAGIVNAKNIAMKQVTKRAASQSSAVYGFGFIGAVIYFIQQATSFWMGALGILKAIVWPAILVYKALEYFAM